jgi:MFS family permease
MNADRIATRTLIVCCAGHLLCHLTMLMFPTLLVTMPRDLGVSATELGWAGWFGYLLFGVGAVGAGWLTDRFGVRFAMTLFFGGVAGGLAILGFAPNMTTIWIGMGVLGLANSIYHPAGMTAISLTQHARRGRSMGILGIAGSVGIAGGALVAGRLGGSFGWQNAYLIVGVGIFLVGLLSLVYLPGKQAMQAVDDHGMKTHAAVATRQGSAKGMILLYLAMTAQGFIYRLMMTTSPLYVNQMAWPDWFGLAWVGTVTSVILFFGIPGQIWGGHVSDRGHIQSAYTWIVGASIAILAGLFFFPGFVGLPLLVLFMLVHFSAQPVENVLIAQRTKSASRSLSYGFKFILTFGAGSLAVPLVTTMIDRGQLQWLFLVAAVMAAGGLLCIRAAGFADRGDTAEAVTSEPLAVDAVPADQT